MKEYKFKGTDKISKKKAKVYGEELARIQEEHKGLLTPQAVVDEARDKTNPLHSAFDWNDKTAGEKYRLEQARSLIRSIEVVVEYDGKKSEINAYVNVIFPKNGNPRTQGYVDIQTAMNDDFCRKEVLKNAMRELVYWQDKYKQFKEFSSVFKIIRSVKVKYKNL